MFVKSSPILWSSSTVPLRLRSAVRSANCRLQAKVYTESKANAPIVPRFGVMKEQSRSCHVIRMVKGKLHKTRVTLGLKTDLELVITGELAENDLIVARPLASDGAEN